MKIKPLVWAEFPNGSGYLAVTPINTTYSIYCASVVVTGAKFNTLHFNGHLLRPCMSLDEARDVA